MLLPRGVRGSTESYRQYNRGSKEKCLRKTGRKETEHLEQGIGENIQQGPGRTSGPSSLLGCFPAAGRAPVPRGCPECKPPVRAGGPGSRAAGSEGSDSVLWRNPKGNTSFCCPVWWLGLRRPERGTEIYIGQCSQKQQLLSPQRTE